MHRISRGVWTAVLAVGVGACTPESDGPVEPGSVPAGASDAAALAEVAAAAQGRNQRGFEDEILRLEARIPGLGGIYLDSTGQAIMYLRDVQNRDAALRELRAAAPTLNIGRSFREKLASPQGPTIRQGRHRFSELVVWQREISRHVRTPGFLAIDADEGLNKVRVTVTAAASQSDFVRQLAKAGVPEDAVTFEVSAPLRFAQIWKGPNLRDRNRPTRGGLQIANSSGLCSLGFNVDVQFYGQKGFLTAAHCDAGGMGAGGTGGSIYQNTVSSSNLVGTVSLNPAWNLTDPNCQGYSLCTYADAMFVLSSNASSSEWSKSVAWTGTVGSNNSRGSLQFTQAVSGLSVVPFMFQGAQVYKTGRTTGTTTGTVAATCENNVVESSVTLCSTRVTGAATGQGDSGGPVFYPQAGTDPAYAIGILFAFGGTTVANDNGAYYCTSGCTMLFSEWQNVQTHLSRYFTP